MTKCTEGREGGREGEAEGDQSRQIPSHANHNNKRPEKRTMTAGKLNTSYKTGLMATMVRESGKHAEINYLQT